MFRRKNIKKFLQSGLKRYKRTPSAAVAQLVEQRIRNAWVGSSNLSCGTSKKPSAFKGRGLFKYKMFFIMILFIYL